MKSLKVIPKRNFLVEKVLSLAGKRKQPVESEVQAKSMKMRLKDTSKARKKFKSKSFECDRESSSDSGNDADMSDLSIMLSKEEERSNKETIYTELIDTTEVNALKEPLSNSEKLKQRKEINKLWEELGSNAISLYPKKILRHLSNDYKDYLVRKLNSLFLKYTYTPWKWTREALRNAKVLLFDFSYLELRRIFTKNNLRQLLSIYFEHLNFPEAAERIASYKKRARRANINKVFTLLLEDYERTHKTAA